MKILYKTTTIHKQPDQIFNPVVRQQSGKIQYRYSIMASKHIHSMNILFYLFLCPLLQVRAIASVKSIQDQSRKEKVICQISLLCYQLILFLFISGMNLRKKADSIWFCKLMDLFKEFPCLRFI